MLYNIKYLLRTLTRHRRTSMFFETWVLWGDARFFALFASGRLSWLLLGWIVALVQGSFWLPRGYSLSPLCGSGVSLGAQESVIAKSLTQCDKIMTWEINWEPFGTHFETAASQNRADKRFVALLGQSFFESVSRSVPKRVFRGNC